MSWHLRIESDGSLISYSLSKTGDWEVEIRIMEIVSTTQACDLPLACGSYGLCRNPSNCSCLNEVSGIALTQAGKCGAAPTWPTRRENCDNNYKTDFVTLHGVRYFTNLYTSPDRVSSSLEECLGSCRTNCSCSALFYDATPRNCYFVNDVFGSLREGVPSYTAYLKFQDRSQLINTRRKFSKRKIDIIITISSVTAATVLVVCLLLLLRRKLVITRKQKEETENLVTALQGLPQRFTYRTLMLATKGFSKQLGTGGFGSVYEGVLPDGRKLAIKKLHSYSAQKEFIAEVTSLGRTSHVNIVQLCGYCAELSHRLLVYEFMPRGSLDKWIFRSQRAALSWNCRYNIALGTARGLAYLHEESREPIIHLDIKPQNILLGDNFEPKVADFGMAKLLMSRDVSMFTTGVRGTPGYLAPEWLMHSAVTKKCDVYSYGMVLLELIGGRRNWDPAKVDLDSSFFFPVWAVNEIKRGRILNVVDPKIRNGVDNEMAERMIKVAFWCIQENSLKRPTMDAVVQMLEGHLEVREPLLDFRFSVDAPGYVTSSGVLCYDHSGFA